jgi:GTP-binding protein Era
MKAGFVALVGLPNAGKSTLVNALIGEKVGIISRKPQTTRKRVVGVYNEEDTQICFIDSPGRIKSETGLNAYLQKELDSVIRESDACIAMLNLDAHNKSDLLEIVKLVKESGRPWFIVINKTDLDEAMAGGVREMKLRDELKDVGVPVVSISAITNSPHGKEKLRREILDLVKERLPESESPLFNEDIYTTQTLKEMAGEIVREKCFEYLHQEVPYGLAVQVVKYDESHPTPRVFVDIIVSKENFVSMVVGKGGMMIKRIGASSRIEFEKVIGQKVYLETHVKVKKDWFKNLETMKELGYVTHD